MQSDPLSDVLRKSFGLQDFRPWQREAIEAVLQGSGRVLVVAPTGGGKSLTYQVPAAVLQGTTLVLSPLVALMEDQVRALEARGIAATFLASTLDADERRRRESAMARGAFKLVYAAPERLASQAFVEMLARSNVQLVAVDEAHCIAQWGHDFRPDYRRIGALLERLRPPRVLACTATATPEVRREIREQLRLGSECAEVLRGFARPNLHLAARSVEGVAEARTAVFEVLASALGEAAAPRGGAIVYAATRKQTEQWAETLRDRGWNAAAYHAGMAAEERSRVATRFSDRSLGLVVATNAFGMGIDRADIRAVVHVQPPSSIEAYYQEVGRAGRDGAEAAGLLLCSGVDIALRRRLVTTGTDGAAASPELAARAWALFRELLRYLDARSCRHDFILRYFGDEQELLGGCGHCDVCASLDALDGRDAGAGNGGVGNDGVGGDGVGGEAETRAGEATAKVVRMALSAVARARQRAGLGAVAEMLRGIDDERTRRFGFTQLSTFGLLRDRSATWVMDLMRGLLAAGWIDLTPTDHPVPMLTRTGAEAMRATGPLRFVLPLERIPARGRKGSMASPMSPMSASSPGSSGSRGAPATDSLDAPTRERFERLRAQRALMAKARGVPAYVVAFDRTLVEMATRSPRSREELLDVFGMGPARVEAYGDGFLEVLRGS
ncbi:MAG TPA: ATP-dependent DNA helicase RecQ [Polyangiaceae bacterium]|jgi:ATP-dependent DNA helicase RecQ|nr:ATP-dependent DNA helicase RecQ [Polyangiaceae bacterium]